MGNMTRGFKIFSTAFDGKGELTPNHNYLDGKRVKASKFKSPGATKSDTAYPVVRNVPAAVGATAVETSIVPRAAPHNTFSFFIIIPAIRPFPNIPRHIHTAIWADTLLKISYWRR